jgi:hypothetical protein
MRIQGVAGICWRDLPGESDPGNWKNAHKGTLNHVPTEIRRGDSIHINFREAYAIFEWKNGLEFTPPGPQRKWWR